MRENSRNLELRSQVFLGALGSITNYPHAIELVLN